MFLSFILSVSIARTHYLLRLAFLFPLGDFNFSLNVIIIPLGRFDMFPSFTSNRRSSSALDHFLSKRLKSKVPCDPPYSHLMKTTMQVIKNYITRVARSVCFTVLWEKASCGCHGFINVWLRVVLHNAIVPLWCIYAELLSFIATHYSYSNIQVVPERFCVSPNWFIAFYLKFQNAF